MILSTENGLLRHNSITSSEKSINIMSLYRCITVNLFVYSPIEEHLAGFQFLIIRNRAAMNIQVQILNEYKFFIFQELILGVWLLSCKASEYLSLGETAEHFSRMAGPFTHQQCKWSNFSAVLPELGIVSIFNFSLWEMRSVITLWLNLHFPNY